ncbi:hypothetical protein PRIPAC_74713 [Pristionchus pacificus]|uniref:Uncharacterized protein n=1 Tax=Pristionchus pacificus TaxID=54126 RepID=A0A2A6CAE1_PRIPA|nr:hypothetical protein PRIPAC_74713 [Pristionchus pacificus]|eukprot:PDM75060.1 hypothetical protein PRIPAC_40441 [Pristionchus pacificus]
MISHFLLFSLLISIVSSAPVLSFKKEFNKEEFAKENIKQFDDRDEFGVAVNMPEDIYQRNYLGLTREAATQMVNMFIKQSIQTSGGDVFNEVQ